MKAIVALALLSLLLAAAARAASVGADVDVNNRIHHQSSKLSEKHHDDVVDHDYDHEAFLGAEEAAEFDDLDPEESKRRLGVIVDQIDSDGDGFVTLQEMRNWIRFSHDRYMSEDVEKQWTQHNQDGKDAVGWEEYRQMVYGFLEEEEGGGVSEDDEVSYKRMESRDLRRWQAADEDGDGSLNKVEFKHFLHPEEAEHMKDIVVLETMEDIDKDGDGFISVDEYIGDMYQGDEGTEEEEPEWIKTERQQFSEIRDSNGDGKMDSEEVKAWILPVEYDHVEAEAKHLIFESDQDQDEKLTKEEILDNFELFVGSQATDFGEALARHDEF